MTFKPVYCRVQNQFNKQSNYKNAKRHVHFNNYYTTLIYTVMPEFLDDHSQEVFLRHSNTVDNDLHCRDVFIDSFTVELVL